MRKSLEFMRDAVLFSYSQVFFCKKRWVALIFILATFGIHPQVGLIGLLGVALANFYAYLFGLDREKIGSGFYGYNAALLSLGIGYYGGLNLPTFFMLFLAAFMVLILTASLENLLGYYFNLPVLALPFVIAMFLIYLAAPFFVDLGYNLQTARGGGEAFKLDFLSLAGYYLRSLGSIFFQGNEFSGFLIFLGLLLYSRLTVFLSLIGFGSGFLFYFIMGGELTQSFFISLGFNAILAAVVLGGIYCLPSIYSFLLAAAASMVSVFLFYALYNLYSLQGIPVLILPFVVTTLFFLAALRVRVNYQKPLLTLYQVGSPEENLLYAMGLQKKARPLLAVHFKLPFKGDWVVSQGMEGQHTHKERFVHALDFFVMDKEGFTSRKRSRELPDFYAFEQPVCAPAAGKVVKVVDGVRDNPIGEVNVDQNWGNLIILHHALGIYSLLAHLACHSIKVKEGDQVKSGDLVGYCGNSGRSPQPHLHFQVQYSREIGSAAVFYPFSSYLLLLEGREGKKILMETAVPKEGEKILNVEPDEKMKSALAFPLGENYSFEVNARGEIKEEKWTVNIDYYGKSYIQSYPGGDILYFAGNGDIFSIYDYHGSKKSALFAFFLAASKIPLCYSPDLCWQDRLPIRLFLKGAPRFFTELVFPFFEAARITSYLKYEEREEKSSLDPDYWSFGVSSKVELSLFKKPDQETDLILERKKGKTLWESRILFNPHLGPVKIEAATPEGFRIEAKLKTRG